MRKGTRAHNTLNNSVYRVANQMGYEAQKPYSWIDALTTNKPFVAAETMFRTQTGKIKRMDLLVQHNDPINGQYRHVFEHKNGQISQNEREAIRTARAHIDQVLQQKTFAKASRATIVLSNSTIDITSAGFRVYCQELERNDISLHVTKEEGFRNVSQKMVSGEPATPYHSSSATGKGHKNSVQVPRKTPTVGMIKGQGALAILGLMDSYLQVLAVEDKMQEVRRQAEAMVGAAGGAYLGNGLVTACITLGLLPSASVIAPVLFITAGIAGGTLGSMAPDAIRQWVENNDTTTTDNQNHGTPPSEPYLLLQQFLSSYEPDLLNQSIAALVNSDLASMDNNSAQSNTSSTATEVRALAKEQQGDTAAPQRSYLQAVKNEGTSPSPDPSANAATTRVDQFQELRQNLAQLTEHVLDQAKDIVENCQRDLEGLQSNVLFRKSQFESEALDAAGRVIQRLEAKLDPNASLHASKHINQAMNAALDTARADLLNNLFSSRKGQISLKSLGKRAAMQGAQGLGKSVASAFMGDQTSAFGNALSSAATAAAFHLLRGDTSMASKAAASALFTHAVAAATGIPIQYTDHVSVANGGLFNSKYGVQYAHTTLRTIGVGAGPVGGVGVHKQKSKTRYRTRGTDVTQETKGYGANARAGPISVSAGIVNGREESDPRTWEQDGQTYTQKVTKYFKGEYEVRVQAGDRQVRITMYSPMNLLRKALGKSSNKRFEIVTDVVNTDGSPRAVRENLPTKYIQQPTTIDAADLHSWKSHGNAAHVSLCDAVLTEMLDVTQGRTEYDMRLNIFEAKGKKDYQRIEHEHGYSTLTLWKRRLTTVS